MKQCCSAGSREGVTGGENSRAENKDLGAVASLTAVLTCV